MFSIPPFCSKLFETDGIPLAIHDEEHIIANHAFDLENGFQYFPNSQGFRNQSNFSRSLVEDYFNSLDCNEIAKKMYLQKSITKIDDSIQETKLYSIEEVVNTSTGIFYVIEVNGNKHLVTKDILPAEDRSAYFIHNSDFSHMFNI